MDNIFKELAKNMPIEKAEEIESKIQTDLAKKLGNDWTDLPVTGPYLLAVFVILNYTLLPLGITPAVITDAVIVKSKELGLDEKAMSLLNNVRGGIKTTGEYSSDKFKDITEYIKTFGDTLLPDLIEALHIDDTLFFVASSINKGKSFIGKLFSSSSKNNQQE